MPGYYDGWESEKFSCSKCEWKGTGAECKQGEMFQELFELDCPKCGGRITVITYPTIEESRANWDKVSEADKRMIEAREQFLKEAESRCLEFPDELPDIPGDNLIFVWDQQKDETVISYGSEIIWREPAFYEGYLRFKEVAVILKKKYGERLRDLVPAERSQNYLLGDYLSAWDAIQSFRDCIGLREWHDLLAPDTKHQTIMGWRKVAVERLNNKIIKFSDSHSAHDLSKLPRLYTTKQLPEIYSDKDLIFVWDEQNAEPIPQIVISYGNMIVWKEFSYYGCYSRFEPIAMLLQQKYGKKVKDLMPTRRSEINLYGDRREAGALVQVVQGNLWMSQYTQNVKDVMGQR